MLPRFKIMLAIVAIFFAGQAAAADDNRIALIQYNADKHFADYDANQANLLALAEEAADAGATIIVFPEGSLHGYAAADRLWCKPGMQSYAGKRCVDVSSIAEDARNGGSVLFWQDFAREHEVTVVISIIEEDAGRYFNTSVVLNGSEVLGTYRKQRLYYVDEAYADPGRSSTVVAINGTRYGLLICMDLNYDTLFQAYKSQGVGNIIAPMNWDQSPHGQRGGKVYFRAQARKHTVNLFVSDQSPWDSTGFYPKTGEGRLRAPLAPDAVDADGFTLVSDSTL